MISGINVNNISGLRFFNLLRFGTIFLIGIAFTKSGLSRNDIGYYEMLLLVASAISTFWLSGLIQSLIPLYKNSKTFNSVEESNNKSPEIFNAGIILFIFSIGAGLFVFLFKNFLSDLLNDSEPLKYLNILILYIVLGGPAGFVEYIYLLKKKPKKIIKYGVISFFFQFILVAGPAIAGLKFEYSLWGLVFSSIFRFGWFIVLLIKYARFKFSIVFIKEHIYLGTPLLLSILMSGSAQYIDGIIISNKFDRDIFAVFKYGAREMPLVMLLANAFSASMISEFREGKNLDKTLEKIKNESIRMIRYLFPLSIVLMLSSHWLYPRVFTPEFADSAIIFNIYLLVIVSRLVFPQTILIGLKKTRIILLASFYEIILNISLSLIFINFFGIAGVAIATIIAYYFEKSFLILFNKNKLKISPSRYIPFKLHIVYSIIIILLFLIIEWQLFC